MVFGPGTISGGPLHRTLPDASKPALVFHCERLPHEGDLRPYSGLEGATAAQVRDFGIVLRTREGAAEPFRTGRIVVWRSGRYAECRDTTQQRTLMYGAEWIVAFLLRDSQNTPPTTLTELNTEIKGGQLVELGWIVSGGDGAVALGEQLQGLSYDWSQSENVLLRRLATLRTAWPAKRLQMDPATPLGVVEP